MGLHICQHSLTVHLKYVYFIPYSVYFSNIDIKRKKYVYKSSINLSLNFVIITSNFSRHFIHN